MSAYRTLGEVEPERKPLVFPRTPILRRVLAFFRLTVPKLELKRAKVRLAVQQRANEKAHARLWEMKCQLYEKQVEFWKAHGQARGDKRPIPPLPPTPSGRFISE